MIKEEASSIQTEPNQLGAPKRKRGRPPGSSNKKNEPPSDDKKQSLIVNEAKLQILDQTDDIDSENASEDLPPWIKQATKEHESQLQEINQMLEVNSRLLSAPLLEQEEVKPQKLGTVKLKRPQRERISKSKKPVSKEKPPPVNKVPKKTLSRPTRGKPKLIVTEKPEIVVEEPSKVMARWKTQGTVTHHPRRQRPQEEASSEVLDVEDDAIDLDEDKTFSKDPKSSENKVKSSCVVIIDPATGKKVGPINPCSGEARRLASRMVWGEQQHLGSKSFIPETGLAPSHPDCLLQQIARFRKTSTHPENKPTFDVDEDMRMEADVLLELMDDDTAEDLQRRRREYICAIDKKPMVIGYKARIFQNSGFRPTARINEKTIGVWKYLVHKKFRRYQFDITETCLFNNTLVCLPTGLGKTFIATNIICNYYRWFIDGKIFFLAPTKPLVTQQIKTVAEVKAIRQSDVAELTGSDSTSQRRQYYSSKRTFFMTPQTLEKDLEKGFIDLNNIVLVIFDEAHRATGEYSYVKIRRLLDQANVGVRIVGLTATPGNTLDSVQEIITNLGIAKIEARWENDPETWKYLQHKEIEPLLISPSLEFELVDIRLRKCIQGLLNRLGRCLILEPNHRFPKNLREATYDKIKTEFEIFKRYFHQYQSLLPDMYFYLTSALANLQRLLSARKLLLEQGMKNFVEHMASYVTKVVADIRQNQLDPNHRGDRIRKELVQKSELREIVDAIRETDLKGVVHPKLPKLREVLSVFFDPSLRLERSNAIVFTQSRQSAVEITEYLNEKDKSIRASLFVGQSTKNGMKGMNQQEQQKIITQLKRREINVLVATAIGEEGLDIGEVDLIICFDSGLSPVRMIQRMGRTGRKRRGRVLLLLMASEMTQYLAARRKYTTLMGTLKANSSSGSGLEKFQRYLQRKKKKNPESATNEVVAVEVGNQEEAGPANEFELHKFQFYEFNPRMIPDKIVPRLMYDNNGVEGAELDHDEDIQEIYGEYDIRIDVLIDNIVKETNQQSKQIQKMSKEISKDPFKLLESNLLQSLPVSEKDHKLIARHREQREVLIVGDPSRMAAVSSPRTSFKSQAPRGPGLAASTSTLKLPNNDVAEINVISI